MGMYLKTERTSPARHLDRTLYDADVVHAILDEALVCHLGFVVDGEPRVLPTLFVRLDDTVYLHGSTGSTPLLGARGEPLPICVTVTLIDGLVLARSQFHHSVNYRSVVAHGRARPVTDPDERLRVLTALVERIAAGRASTSRPPTAKELAATSIIALPLREVSAKVRTGKVSDEPEDYALPHWAGVLPLTLTAGPPIPDDGLAVPVPGYLQPEPWKATPTLRGRHVVLEPLVPAHAGALFAELDDEEVWRHLTNPRPTSPAETAELIMNAITDPNRLPMVQKDAVTGAVLGTTSYYAPDPANRSIAIGHTILGRRSWRTPINTEAKLLLLTRAFEELGTERVEWHTDIRNERSQRAIARLGATREGVLRAHKRRPDGSLRDTVLFAMTAADWPSARERLNACLA